MAYPETQAITDTDRRHVVKAVNIGVTQTDVLLVNASALGYAVQVLTTTSSANNFRVGENVASGAGGTAIVQDVVNSTSVMLINVAGSWPAGNTITGVQTTTSRVQSGALAPVPYVLHCQSVAFNISGNTTTKLELKWQGNGGGANSQTIAVLTGAGKLEFAALAARIPPQAVGATGSVTLSTVSFPADAHYTLVLDMAKVSGYAPPYLDRNQTIGR